MTISTYVLNLITIPYLTRILGPTVYGRIGLVQGYMAYVQIILDFGFTLSATCLISENKEDLKKVGEIISSVTAIKIFLAVLIFFAFGTLYYKGFFDATNAMLIILYMPAYLMNALLPDYFYRGIENMKAVAIRTLIIKLVFTLLIFFFVKSKNDVYFVPVSFMLGCIFALAATLYDIRQNHKIIVSFPKVNQIKRMFSITFPFFVSRFASTFYQALDVIILGKIYGTAPELGYYTSCDKIISLAKTGSSPIADSLYPYMLNQQNYRLVKKLLLIAMPIITVSVAFVWIFSIPICILIFGEEYAEAGNILRLLLPIVWIILPTYIIAFPVMVPLGLTKYANLSNVVGMCIQIGGLSLLFLTENLNIYSVCALTSFTEVAVFVYRLTVVLIHLWKGKKSC